MDPSLYIVDANDLHPLKAGGAGITASIKRMHLSLLLSSEAASSITRQASLSRGGLSKKSRSRVCYLSMIVDMAGSTEQHLIFHGTRGGRFSCRLTSASEIISIAM